MSHETLLKLEDKIWRITSDLPDLQIHQTFPLPNIWVIQYFVVELYRYTQM